MRCTFWLLFPVSFFVFVPAFSQSESKAKPSKDWFLKDPEADQVQGLSTERAYTTLLANKPSKTVIVAVVDTGVDIDHEDLKNVIWVNEDEIPDNGIDDDKNGYVDDVNGWNFIGGKNGNVNEDTYEVTREYVRLKSKYEKADVAKLSKKEKREYATYLAIVEKWEAAKKENAEQLALVGGIYSNAIFSLDLLKKFLKSDEVSLDQVTAVQSNDPEIIFAKSFFKNFFNGMSDGSAQEKLDDLKDAYDSYKFASEYSVNPDFEPRDLVGDNYLNTSEKYYGNNQVKPMRGPVADHGTHVAGIIAADRKNDLGIKGIADHVKIMAIRAVPNGDERDKDIANAIFYAVDNGAKIINLSCGKTESPQKEAVDKAVQYAETRGVLIIHAAGNESSDNDVATQFPSPRFNNGRTAKNWIDVGASSWGVGKNFIGSFSNYGKKTVDEIGRAHV